MILINKDRKGLFFFTVKSKNGQVLCHSEGYTRKENAKKAVMVLSNQLLRDSDYRGWPYDESIIDQTNGK